MQLPPSPSKQEERLLPLASEEGETARTTQPERRAEEERPGREETSKEEDIIEKAKRKMQGQ
jgi:hypothetical protein